MRRAWLATTLVLFMLGASWSAMPLPAQTVSHSTGEVDVPTSTWRADEVHVLPSVDHWASQGDSLVEVMVFTRDLSALHEWQMAHGLLPKQAPTGLGQEMVTYATSSDILEHRTIEMPGKLVPKMVGVHGTLAIFDAAWSADPYPAEMGAPASVKSGEIHGANDAWTRGYNGSGVRVAVADSGVDFAHPDLNGTQARLDNQSSPYHGWPVMHDPVSILYWLRDGTAYPAQSRSWWADTSSVEVDANNDTLLDGNGWDISGILPSQSGDYHHGLHPDSRLINRAGGDVPVLVVDTVTAGVYDTVYIDIDRDGEFGDESPVRKGAETYGRDTNGDGLWDQSAGLVWWISDGVNGVPYASVYAPRAGYNDRIAGSGDLVLFMLNDASEAGGNHGTLCASAVAAQGKVANGAVLGMAPGAEIVAVSNLYAGGSWLDAFRFISEGYDGNVTTDADQAHIGSFSFGNSAANDDGADYWSLYLDWLTRVHSPETAYFVAVGNGGHGYGTTASPGGAHGVISVGAFSSKGDTWGESASWSNRGPNSVSRLDPDIVAVGWSATGDRTLNEVTNANSAYTTWSGTSLATPIAAGLGAVIYDAWRANHGDWPDSQAFRDLVMSTADDRGYDPMVQGGGWMNASRASAALDGENGSLTVSPGAWMTGNLDGAHRDGNLNFITPGENQTTTMQLHNPGSVPLNVSLQPAHLAPVAHFNATWSSTESGGNNSTWDGHQSGRPDFVFPLHIKGDANLSLPNGTTLVRARGVMEGAGFDGNWNYQSENRLHIRIWRWTDTDGDGAWWTDLDGDGRVGSAAEWTEAGSEFDMITEHVYASPQVEARVGHPLDWGGDGLLVAYYRDEVRTSQKDPLNFAFDWTAFGPANDTWITAPSSVSVPANGSANVSVNIDVAASARGGLVQHGIRLEAGNHSWVWPIITNVAFTGPFDIEPKPVDHNMSNQSLYEETWLQGAQRWGWRAESGDWKFLTLDWPTTLSGNGSIIIDVDWPDNAYTDVDVHWMGEVAHPFFHEMPGAYGPNSLTVEVGSTNRHRGSGVWSMDTTTGGSNELLVAGDSPGTKQMMLRSTMHGVNTNDNPLNISVGYAAPMGGVTGQVVEDWSLGSANGSLQIGATLPLEVADVRGIGFARPVLLPQLPASQDDAGDVSTSSFTYPFTLSGASQYTVEIGSSHSGVDLDLYVYRDTNGNGAIDWGSEQVGSSGNWNADESITLLNPADGDYWVVVHGYDLWGTSNTTFWMRTSTLAGNDFSVTNWSALNESEIAANYSNGSATLGGLAPESVIDVNLSWTRPLEAGLWDAWVEVELASGGEMRLPWQYTLVDPPPTIEFNRANGSRTNQSLSMTMQVHDRGTGFNISGLDVACTSTAGCNWPDGADLNVQTLDGTWLNDSVSMPWWRHWQNNTSFSSGDHFTEEFGLVALEAESAQSISGDADRWAFSDLSVGHAGAGFMEAGDPSGDDYGDTTDGSRMSWEIEFTSTGTYYVWARMAQNTDDHDAIHIGLDGNLTSYGGEGMFVADPGWNWANSIENETLNWRAFVDVATPGRHTFDVWVKEDGVQLDRLVLVQSATWTPGQTTGPNESAFYEDLSLREAWLNWTLPPSRAWTTYDVLALDLTNRLGQQSLAIEHDDIRPPIIIDGYQRLYRDPADLQLRMLVEAGSDVWVNGSLLPPLEGIPEKNSVWRDLNLSHHPSIFGPSGDVWDPANWSWHDLNVFDFTLRDAAGNWNHAEMVMAWDPYAPSPHAQIPQVELLSIDGTHAVDGIQALNLSTFEVDVRTIFDVREVCIDLVSSTGGIATTSCLNQTTPVWNWDDLGLRDDGSPDWVHQQSGWMGSAVQPNPEWHVPVNLTGIVDDRYEVRLRVEDWAGNTASIEGIVHVDRTAPEHIWHHPPDQAVLADHFLNLSWVAGESSTQQVEVNGVDIVELFGNGTQDAIIELNRTGNHSVCLRFTDDALEPNRARTCRTYNLPAETYWPQLDAPWNGSTLAAIEVMANVTLGPDQSYRWYRLDVDWIEQPLTPVSNGSAQVTIPLSEGLNQFRFELEALERLFVYELEIIRDTQAPIIAFTDPADTFISRASNVRLQGTCEVGLAIEVDAGGVLDTIACRPDGTFDESVGLPSGEGWGDLIIKQTDEAGLIGHDALQFEIDYTSPTARLTWDGANCGPIPPVAIWASPQPAPCSAQVSVQSWDDDIASMELRLTGPGLDEVLIDPTTHQIEGEAGTWVAELTLIDDAGNVGTVRVTIDLPAEDAALSDRAMTPGTLENLSLLSILLGGLFIGSLAWRGRHQEAEQAPQIWTDEDVQQIIDTPIDESEFDAALEGRAAAHDDAVASNVEGGEDTA